MIVEIALPSEGCGDGAERRFGFRFQAADGLAEGQALAKDRERVDVVGHHDGAAELPSAVGVQRTHLGEDVGRESGRGEAGTFLAGADREKIFRVRDRDATAAQRGVAFRRIAHGFPG